MDKKVSIIIPSKNEEKTIEYVINLVKDIEIVDEVIVVDNASTDNTNIIATNAGATVIKCSEIGKGNSMAAGYAKARNEVLVYLDSDIITYSKDIVDILSRPIFNNEADFVKSTFNRTKGGLVTEIATKPMLELLFPKLEKFGEPLSGMIGVKKSVLKDIKFEKDYGVDIGLILDMHKNGHKMVEVNIGCIENTSHNGKTNNFMSNMSKQVLRTILEKSKN